MKRKIYGAPGQMECKLIIKNGQFSAEVHFRGGSIINRAGRPASYATSRFIEQDIIGSRIEAGAVLYSENEQFIIDLRVPIQEPHLRVITQDRVEAYISCSSIRRDCVVWLESGLLSVNCCGVVDFKEFVQCSAVVIVTVRKDYGIDLCKID